MERTCEYRNKVPEFTLCYTIMLPGRKSAFRGGFSCFPGSSPAKIRLARPISGPEALLRNIEYVVFAGLPLSPNGPGPPKGIWAIRCLTGLGNEVFGAAWPGQFGACCLRPACEALVSAPGCHRTSWTLTSKLILRNLRETVARPLKAAKRCP